MRDIKEKLIEEKLIAIRNLYKKLDGANRDYYINEKLNHSNYKAAIKDEIRELEQEILELSKEGDL